MSKVIFLDEEYTNRDEGELIVVLGNFDGFHIGHRSLFEEAIALKEETGGVTSAIIFDASPAQILHHKSQRYITPLNDKVAKLDEMGIDVIYIIHMTESFLRKTKEEFLDFLQYSLHPIAVVVGEDYSFGYKAEGKVEHLQTIFGDSLHVMTLLRDENGNKFSTQSIVKLIENGNIEEANKELMEPYSVVGKVIPGKQKGRTIGFPTANIELLADYVIPMVGVYTGVVSLDDCSQYPSIINVGSNPTVNEDGVIRIEAFLDGYDGDLYDRLVQVTFLTYIRGEKKFSSLDELKTQLETDIQLIR